jgi:DNA polymerase alpha subunit A
MQWEVREKDVWNQLQYFQALFDVDRVTKAGEIGADKEREEREKAKVLAEINRERFGTVKDVVGRWLERNGRQWVQMDNLFAFALKR